MRLHLTLAALTLIVAPLATTRLAAQGAKRPAKAADHDRAAKVDADLPPGWTARTDSDSDLVDVKFVTMAPGYHVTLGPAAILYRAADKMTGPFHVSVTFTQTKAPPHPEGYGIFIGGKNLDGPARQYTYFMIRGDGRYLIKRRSGDSTSSIISGWSRHPAIVHADRSGKATNDLEVVMAPDKASFMVNGREVYNADPRLFDAAGIVGLRINHNLDLHIADYTVTKQ
ncbi:MAG TPA: hypothetical protein VFW66_10185 [Gemmatimonadales bacterium]|nr:hypothetical protein [Gemmatimonadales bacterium]